MTVEQAIDLLENLDGMIEDNHNSDYDSALKMGKEALEKQIPKKPIGRHTDYKCSVCGRRVRSGKGSSSRQRDNFCQRCGQKLDWEEGGTSD